MRAPEHLRERGPEISRLTVIFATLLLLLALGFAAVVMDGTGVAPSGEIQAMAMVTRLPGPALGAHYLEPRCRLYGDFSTTLYPELPPINYLDFVYAP